MSGSKNKKIKGSVLYTVVAVMSIMTILVFAAMTLAASAHRRTYNNLANNQSQFTAKSILDSITSDPRIVNDLAKCPVGKKRTITVDGIDSSMGTLKDAYIERSSNTNYKLVVTVEMLGQENTIAAYYTIPDVKVREGFNYSFVSLSKGNFSGIDSMGGISLSSSYSEGINSGAKFDNGTFLDSPIRVNGDLTLVTPLKINLTQRDGLFAKGRMEILHNTTFKSILLLDSLNYRELPYIFNYERYYGSYSGGDIFINNVTLKFGDWDSPMLVIGRNINEQPANTYPLYGDLYLYDRYDTSYVSGTVCSWTKDEVLAKRTAGSNLVADMDEAYKGGNLYSQGAVAVNVQDGGSTELANNVIADKFSDAPLIGGDGAAVTRGNQSDIITRGIIVSKNVNLGRKISVNSGTDPKGFFGDPDRFEITAGDKINGVEYPEKAGGTTGKYLASKSDACKDNDYYNSLPSDKQNNLKESDAEYFKVYPNIYWNSKDNRDRNHIDEKPHAYSFDLSNLKDVFDGYSYDPDYYDFILKDITIDVDDASPVYWATINTKLYDGGISDNNLYAQFTPTPPDDILAGYKCYFVNRNTPYGYDNNFTLSCRFPFVEKFREVNETELKDCKANDEIKLREGINTLTFEIDGLYKFGLDNPKLNQMKVNGIYLNIEARKKSNSSLAANYLRKANDIAFAKEKAKEDARVAGTTANNIFDEESRVYIQVDDIDKSVRIIKNYDNTYTIEKADLTSVEEGKENTDAVFRQIAYDPTAVYEHKIGVEAQDSAGNKLTIGSRKVGKITYKDDIPESEKDKWIYSFDDKNYDKFLKAVVETVSYPETMGTHQLYGEMREFDTSTGDLKRIITDENKNYIGPIVDRSLSPQGVLANYRYYTSWKSYYKPSWDSPFSYKEYTPTDFGVSKLYLYDPEKEMNNETPFISEVSSVKTPIMVYQTYTDGGYTYPKMVELSNVIVSQARFGYTKAFVDDTQLYGNVLRKTSDLREYAKTRTSDLVTASASHTSSPVYGDGTAYPAVITNSCTFKKSVPNGKEITLKPKGDMYIKLVPDDTVETEIEEYEELDRDENGWVKYDSKGREMTKSVNKTCEYKNFTFGKNVKITVDDSEGTVNFIVPKGASVVMAGNARILTKYYEKECDDGDGYINVPNNPAIEKSLVACIDHDKIPDVYFYMEPEDSAYYKVPGDDNAVDFSKMAKFQMREGGNILSGYILAAYVKLKTDGSGTLPQIKYHYAKVPCKETSSGSEWLSGNTSDHGGGNLLMGGCIFEHAKVGTGTLTVGYVNPNPTDERGNKFAESTLQFQYYQAY